MPHALGHSQRVAVRGSISFPHNPNERQNRRTMKNGKRILSVTVRRMIDESPDTSWLGEYSNRPETEYAIDRAHAQDCASLNPRNDEGLERLDRIQSAICDNLPDDRELQPHRNYYLQEEIDAIDSLDECRPAMESDCSGGGTARGTLR